jgi:hypothetical protein
MNPLFDSAGLACVAYAEIIATQAAIASGQFGPSGTNSGITATRLATGQYLAFLPTGQQQAPYQHTTPSGSVVTSESDLVFVQPKASPVPTNVAVVPMVDPNAQVTGQSGQTAVAINLFGVSLGSSPVCSAVDCDFTLLVLRTIIPDV